jgi:hypothetical protein
LLRNQVPNHYFTRWQKADLNTEDGKAAQEIQRRNRTPLSNYFKESAIFARTTLAQHHRDPLPLADEFTVGRDNDVAVRARRRRDVS